MPTSPSADRPRRSYLLPGFLLLSLIWGSSFLFIKIGLRALHPTYLALGRVGLGAGATLVALLLLRERLPRDPRVWAHLAVVGGVGMVLPFTLFGFAEQRVPSLLAGIWNATTPLATLPLAALVFRTEWFTVRKLAGIGVGFVGVLIVLGVWTGTSGATLTGQMMCLAAATYYGITMPYLRRFLIDQPVSDLALVCGQLLAATAILAVVAPLAAGPPPPLGTLSVEVIASVVVLGVFGSGVAFLLHLRNIRLVGASAASLVTYLAPLFAVLAGVVVLGESLRWHQPAGALLVLSGVAIIQGVRFRRRRLAEADQSARAPAVAASGPRPQA